MLKVGGFSILLCVSPLCTCLGTSIDDMYVSIVRPLFLILPFNELGGKVGIEFQCLLCVFGVQGFLMSLLLILQRQHCG